MTRAKKKCENLAHTHIKFSMTLTKRSIFEHDKQQQQQTSQTTAGASTFADQQLLSVCVCVSQSYTNTKT